MLKCFVKCLFVFIISTYCTHSLAMPRNRRRRMSRRRRRPKTSTRALALRALHAVNQEIQFADVEWSMNNVSDAVNGFTWYPLTEGITRGTAITQRLGNTITLLRSDLRLIVTKNAANVDPSTFVRLIYVYDKEPDGALPQDNDFLTVPVTTNPRTEIRRFRYLNKTKRFTVLFDRTVVLADGFKAWNTFTVHTMLKNRTVRFNANNGTVADIEFGALYLLVGGSITNGGNVSQISGYHRLRFRF